ncbi:MAG: adenosylcobinamide-GDP ribazoletransferase [Methyloceanibacter sp.]
MAGGVSAKALSTDLRTGLAFLTRLPLVHSQPTTGADLVRASWTFPIVGVGVGAFGALIYWLMHALGLHAFVCAVLAVAGTALITGCLHEDGLADTADGFGAGGTPERKLEIMRDSQIGAYGATTLTLSLLLRVGAIASLAEPALAALALIAAHAGARATLPVFMRRVPRARQDGLSADAGMPPQRSSVMAVVIGLVVLLLCLGLSATLIAIVLLAAALGLMAWLSISQIGGQTGDVLGAVEQICEILILLVATVWL